MASAKGNTHLFRRVPQRIRELAAFAPEVPLNMPNTVGWGSGRKSGAIVYTGLACSLRFPARPGSDVGAVGSDTEGAEVLS